MADVECTVVQVVCHVGCVAIDRGGETPAGRVVDYVWTGLLILPADGCQHACGGVDDISCDGDICGDEWVMPDEADCPDDCRPGVAEALEPLHEVDAAAAYGVDGLPADAACCHGGEHLASVHVLCTAIGVGYDHDIGHSEFVDGYEQAAHSAVKRCIH